MDWYMETIVQAVKEQCQEIMSGIDKDEAHNWSHVVRVKNMCLRLCSGLNLDTNVLELMAWFHDIGRIKEKYNGGGNHAQFSYEMAIPILDQFPIPAEIKQLILQAVLEHNKLNDENDSIYLQLLKDADRLDCMGVMGVYRIVHDTSNQDEFVKGLDWVLEFQDMLRIPAALSIGRPRYDYLVHFKELFLQES